MDIRLSDGMCFEIFEQVKVDSNIVFTTAYSDYSIRAFNYNGIFYLLKPINKDELKIAIEKAQDYYEQEEQLRQFEELKKVYEVKNYKNSFAVTIGSKIKIIKTEEISYLFSFKNATYLRSNESNYIINHSLTNLENQLNPEHFYRVNRTFIVHVNSIKEIISYTNSRLKLILHSYNESEIIVSRERVKDFKQWIDR